MAAIKVSMKVNGKDVTTTVLMSRFGEPVSIEAASLEVRDKDRVATFSGNVRVVQGDTTAAFAAASTPVWPTMSGITVDRRDQVFTTFLSDFAVLSGCTRFELSR